MQVNSEQRPNSKPLPQPLKQKSSLISLATLRKWHWISSALCLVGMLLFAVTGITLNNARLIPAQPIVTTIETELTPTLLTILQQKQDGKVIYHKGDLIP